MTKSPVTHFNPFIYTVPFVGIHCSAKPCYPSIMKVHTAPNVKQDVALQMAFPNTLGNNLNVQFQPFTSQHVFYVKLATSIKMLLAVPVIFPSCIWTKKMPECWNHGMAVSVKSGQGWRRHCACNRWTYDERKQWQTDRWSGAVTLD